MPKLNDYQYQSQDSFITDKTEQLIERIKSCKEGLKHCENRKEMTAKFKEAVEENLLALAEVLEDIKLEVPLDLSESSERLDQMSF